MLFRFGNRFAECVTTVQRWRIRMKVFPVRFNNDAVCISTHNIALIISLANEKCKLRRPAQQSHSDGFLLWIPAPLALRFISTQVLADKSGTSTEMTPLDFAPAAAKALAGRREIISFYR